MLELWMIDLVLFSFSFFILFSYSFFFILDIDEEDKMWCHRSCYNHNSHILIWHDRTILEIMISYGIVNTCWPQDKYIIIRVGLKEGSMDHQ